MNDFELWQVNDHEGLTICRKLREGQMPRVNALRPGGYVLCDAGGNLLEITVRDASGERAEEPSLAGGGEAPF